jgi:3-oxosteroid 1-dehydrogenase
MNGYAQTGIDLDFHRGENAYDLKGGDPANKPNPCLGRIEQAPFYALRLVAGHLGTFAGIKADKFARALNRDNQPIAGLYAVGNDMGSALGGDYPGRGGTIGPGMTFAYIAARHVAGVA